MIFIKIHLYFIANNIQWVFYQIRISNMEFELNIAFQFLWYLKVVSYHKSSKGGPAPTTINLFGVSLLAAIINSASSSFEQKTDHLSHALRRIILHLLKWNIRIILRTQTMSPWRLTQEQGRKNIVSRLESYFPFL